MTSGIRAIPTHPARTDGIRLGSRLAPPTPPKPVENQFWVSNPRLANDRSREVLEIAFGAPKLVNHLSFQTARHPHTLLAEYVDEAGEWAPFTYAAEVPETPVRTPARTPVRLSIGDTIPAVITGQTYERTWVPQTWRTQPVRTDRVRFVLQRIPEGDYPRTPNGKATPYSLALRDVQVGYRITSLTDVPREPGTSGNPFASARDLLGSRVGFSLYEQGPGKAIDGNDRTAWRSDPQPVNYAVVNYYLDLRDTAGESQVIDRFFIDPLTLGVHCNVYHSDSLPEGDYRGSSDPVPDPQQALVGGPTVERDPATGRGLWVALRNAGFEVSDNFLQIRSDDSWWVGLDAVSLEPLDASARTLLTVAGGSLRLSEDGLVFEAATGQTVTVPVDPTLHVQYSGFRVVLGYHPATPSRAPYIRLAYQSLGHEVVAVEQAVPVQPDDEHPFRVGLRADLADNDAAIGVAGLVLKSEDLTDATEDWFLAEGEAYVADPVDPREQRNTHLNAALRMHPSWVGDTNIFGTVGGPGERFDQMVWTPVARDYSLRRGWMMVPATKAKFWKFEFTNLVPEIYENFLTITRVVKVFPPGVVNTSKELTAATTDAIPFGTQTNLYNADTKSYADAIETLRALGSVDSSTTDVLVLRDADRALKASKTGWVWQYHPWHVGVTAPQFVEETVHKYEPIRIQQHTKVAYFVGLKEITPFRVDYSADDDTPEYEEHFLDLHNIDTHSGVEHTVGAFTSFGSSGQITSKTLTSYRAVRGVQFATQETDAFQVFPDPDFIEPDLTTFWTKYGDAVLTRESIGDVRVDRGWFPYTYGDLEAYTYGTLEERTYGRMEGNNPTGSAEGGLTSVPFTPSGGGRMTVKVDVSAAAALRGEIRVEIVSTYGDVVLASAERHLIQGERATISVGYTPATQRDRRTYGDLEDFLDVLAAEQGTPPPGTPATYGDLEGRKYGDLESVTLNSDVYVRVRQMGPSDDVFHLHRVALYEAPVVWSFSVDDGATWWPAMDVRNDPHAVLIFPAPGTALRWRAETFRKDASISGLHIRPWYGGRSATAEPAHDMDALGPTTSVYDDFPHTHRHPMWLYRFNPVESTAGGGGGGGGGGDDRFWRNLVLNPSGEGTDTDTFIAEGGTFTPAYEWTVES